MAEQAGTDPAAVDRTQARHDGEGEGGHGAGLPAPSSGDATQPASVGR